MGLVCNSSERIAESRSDRVDAAPCILVPPVMLTFVLEGAGDAALDDLALDVTGGESMSEMSGPEAEGGDFNDVDEVLPEVVLGS